MKKVIVVLLCLIMTTLTFAGCAQSTEPAAANEDTDGTAQQANEQTSDQPVVPFEYIDDERLGASMGNLNKGGIAAQQSEWLYYADGEKIVKMAVGVDGQTIYEAKSGEISNLNALDDWIYFKRNSWIYRISTDGAEVQELAETAESPFLVCGAYIYYRNNDEDKKLYRMRTDGTGQICLVDHACQMLDIENGVMYLFDDGYHMMDLATLKQEPMPLPPDELQISYFHFVQDGCVVYSVKGAHSIKKFDIETQEVTHLVDKRNYQSSPVVCGEWLYYDTAADAFTNSGGQAGRLYQVKLDGTERTMIDEDYCKVVNVTQDWIFYWEYFDLTKQFVLHRGQLGAEEAAEDDTDSEAPTDEVIEVSMNKQTIDAGATQTVGVLEDGKAVAVGADSSGQCSVSAWLHIVSVAAGDFHTVGLTASGSVKAIGKNDDGQCDTGQWSDIAAVSAGKAHTVGLKIDGTAVATGSNDAGQCKVAGWSGIVAVSAGGYHTVGLHADGTVVATGRNTMGQCDVETWSDIVAVAAGSDFTIGLRSDGTVVATGNNDKGQCDVDTWMDIVAISAGGHHTVGLKEGGTVVATGSDSNGECDVGAWKDIVGISAGSGHTVAVKADGSAVAVGFNESSRCDVTDWTLALPEDGGYAVSGG